MRARKILSLAALCLVALSGVASATIVASGNNEARFNGALQVQARQDRQPAPARLFFRARLGTVNGDPRAPALSRISLALSPRIEVDARGLPICRLGQLADTSSAEALGACGNAKVGKGFLRRHLLLRDQIFSAPGEDLIAFNGRYRGRRAIFVHTEGIGKIATRLVIVLRLEKTAGGAGYTLVSALPPVLYEGQGTPLGSRISRFTLSLGRSFEFKGSRRSYLTASCPTAAELATNFTMAHMTLDFGEEAEPLTGAVRGECGPPSGAGS